MFFPRLRNHAKWMFVFLALVFAIGFVGFGVGTGSSGIGDALQGNFKLFGGGETPSQKKEKRARAKLKKNPSAAGAWSNLAAALTEQNKLGKANAAWERYVKLRPKDADAHLRIAGYWQTHGSNLASKARSAQLEAPGTVGPPGIVTLSGPLGNAIGQDPISQDIQQRTTKLFQDAVSAYQKAKASYQRVTVLRPDDQNSQFQLGEVALQLGDQTTAIAAYKKAIAIAPDDAIAQLARQRLALLAGQSGATGG